jgi:flavodoxin I
MASLVQSRGAKVIGSTSCKGYSYEGSKAEVNGEFVGLLLDQETQPRLSKDRIAKWVEDLKTQFGN